MPEHHVLFIDERGDERLTGGKNTYLVGGFAAAESHLPVVAEVWNDTKRRLCGSDAVELKWAHFFAPDYRPNPLLDADDPIKRIGLAYGTILNIATKTKIVPLIARTLKKGITDGAFVTRVSQAGNRVLDTTPLESVLLAQFAHYLKVKNATSGSICMDRRGGVAEQQRRKSQFRSAHEYILSKQSLMSEENRALIARISPDLQFLDSATSPLIQVADVITGPLWAASENEGRNPYDLLDGKFIFYALSNFYTQGLMPSYTLSLIGS